MCDERSALHTVLVDTSEAAGVKKYFSGWQRTVCKARLGAFALFPQSTHGLSWCLRGLGLGEFYPVPGIIPGLYGRSSPWYNLNCTKGLQLMESTQFLDPETPTQSVRGLTS